MASKFSINKWQSQLFLFIQRKAHLLYSIEMLKKLENMVFMINLIKKEKLI